MARCAHLVFSRVTYHSQSISSWLFLSFRQHNSSILLCSLAWNCDFPVSVCWSRLAWLGYQPHAVAKTFALIIYRGPVSHFCLNLYEQSIVRDRSLQHLRLCKKKSEPSSLYGLSRYVRPQRFEHHTHQVMKLQVWKRPRRAPVSRSKRPSVDARQQNIFLLLVLVAELFAVVALLLPSPGSHLCYPDRREQYRCKVARYQTHPYPYHGFKHIVRTGHKIESKATRNPPFLPPTAPKTT